MKRKEKVYFVKVDSFPIVKMEVLNNDALLPGNLIQVRQITDKAQWADAKITSVEAYDGKQILYVTVKGVPQKADEPEKTMKKKEQDAFNKHLEAASKIVNSWPAWKQNVLGQVTPEQGLTNRLDKLLQHKLNVQQNCIMMAEKLFNAGKDQFARDLIAAGFSHDNSKLFGLEWDVLVCSDASNENFAQVVKHHASTNTHHPENWEGGIHGMDDVALAEMVCDWKARANEQGTSLRDWIEKEATKRFEFSANDEVYQKITEYASLILEPIFTKP